MVGAIKNQINTLADRQKTIVGVPVVVEPVEVEVPLGVVPVEVGNVAVAVLVLPDQCANFRPRHHPLNALRIESNSMP